MTKSKMSKETETEKTETASIVPPFTVGNPTAAASFAIEQSHMEDFANAEEKPDDVEYGKPHKSIFFTVLPETGKDWKNRKYYFVLEIKDRDPYVVAPHIAKARKDEDVIRPILIVRYITMAGGEGLWPLKLDKPDTKKNSWNTSAQTILEVASSGKWVRMGRGNGCYTHTISPKTFEQVPPRPSKRSFDSLFDSCFKDDQRVSSLDHEIWKILDEGSET